MGRVEGGRVRRRGEVEMILRLGLCLSHVICWLIFRPTEGKKRRRRRRSGQSNQGDDDDEVYTGDESESGSDSAADEKKCVSPDRVSNLAERVVQGRGQAGRATISRPG